jgi:hypothetical protein
MVDETSTEMGQQLGEELESKCHQCWRSITLLLLAFCWAMPAVAPISFLWAYMLVTVVSKSTAASETVRSTRNQHPLLSFELDHMSR